MHDALDRVHMLPSTHLPSGVAVVELVLVPVRKLLREPLLNLFVCELFAVTLQEGEGNEGREGEGNGRQEGEGNGRQEGEGNGRQEGEGNGRQEGEGNGGQEGEAHLRTYVLVQMYVHAYVDTADDGSGR